MEIRQAPLTQAQPRIGLSYRSFLISGAANGSTRLFPDWTAEYGEFITKGVALGKLVKATIWLSALAFLVPASHASMIFDANATASNGADLTGTITIDTVLGTVTALDLSLSAPGSFSTTHVGLQGPGGSGFYSFLTASGPFYALLPFFQLPGHDSCRLYRRGSLHPNKSVRSTIHRLRAAQRRYHTLSIHNPHG